MGTDISGSQGSLADQASTFASNTGGTCVNSQEQIFSPIQIKKVGSSATPGFEQPSGGEAEDGPFGFGAGQVGPGAAELNPYFSKVFGDDGSNWIKETDFQMMGNDGVSVRSDDEGDLNIRKLKDRGEVGTVQVNSLRGPLILSGFGFDVADRPVPSIGAEGEEALSFDERVAGDRTTWKTGPVNLQWDDERKVWQGGPQILCGVLEGSISAPTTPCIPTTFILKVFRLDGFTEGGTLSNCLLDETIVCHNRDPSLTQPAVAGLVFVVCVRINYEWIPLWVGCPDDTTTGSGDDGDDSLPSCIC
tara:strand:- start:61351 stop:62262 length:912 start_codon:yes stop_codon:yes gene_type:complete